MKNPRAVYVSRLLGFAFVSLLLSLYVALMPCVQQETYRLVLFQPWKYPKGDYQVRSLCGVTAKDVNFKTADGSMLHALYFKNPKGKNTVLIHHGSGMNLTLFLGYTLVFVHGGSSVFIYDYRGFGKSKGTPSWKGVLEDGQSAYNYLVNDDGVPKNKLVNCGLSLGTGPATYVSANNECAGLFLGCPYSSLRKVGKENLKYLALYPDFLFPEQDINSLEMISKVKCPVAILHGTNDATIHYKHSVDLFAKINAPKKLYLIDKMGHVDMLDDKFLPETMKITQAFARDPLASTNSASRICQK
jgi:pimeloyl-ACP methyl ester carboxylesterase